MGLGVLGFLAIFALLCWLSYQSIWADKKKR
jgi:cytochrome c1